MKCKNCKHWHKNIPSDYPEQSIRYTLIKPNSYGFCEVIDDVMFDNESCVVSAKQRKKAIPLLPDKKT